MQHNLVNDIPDELMDSYLNESEIAVDTELHGLKLLRDEVCLVQICDDKNKVSLVKPKNNQTPPNLMRLFTDQSVQKVFHFLVSLVFCLNKS